MGEVVVPERADGMTVGELEAELEHRVRVVAIRSQEVSADGRGGAPRDQAVGAHLDLRIRTPR